MRAQLVLVSVPRLPLRGVRSMSPGPDFRGADRERCVSYFTLLWWSKNALSAMAGRRKRPVRCVGSSGDLLPPSPPAEKATARQDQARNACSNNRSWHCSRSSSGGKCVFKKATSCIQSVGLLLHYELLASE